MQFTMNVKELQFALNTIKHVVPKKSIVDVLKNVKIEVVGETVFLSGTDLSSNIVIKLDSAYNLHDGSILVNHVDLSESVKYMDKKLDVTIRVYNPKQIIVETENISGRIDYVNIDEYPRIEYYDHQTYTVLFDGKELRDVLKKVISSSSSDKDCGREFLQKIQIEFQKDLVVFRSIDGFRLSIIKLNMTNDYVSTILLSRESVEKMIQIFSTKNSIYVSVNDDDFIFCQNDTYYAVHKKIPLLGERPFPDVYRYIPPIDECTVSVEIDRKKLLNTVSPFKNKETNRVWLDIDTSIQIYTKDANNPLIKSATCEYITKNNETCIKYAMNIHHVTDALKVFDDDTIHLYWQSIDSPIQIKNADGSHLVLIMPHKYAI